MKCQALFSLNNDFKKKKRLPSASILLDTLSVNKHATNIHMERTTCLRSAQQKLIVALDKVFFNKNY